LQRQSLNSGGSDTHPSPVSLVRLTERNNDILAVEADGISSDSEAGIDEAASGRYVELPFVPRAAHDAMARPEHDRGAVGLEGGRNHAGAEGRSSVGTAIRECVEVAGDTVEADAVSVDLEHSYGTLVRRVA
jgi:hypothetical protein